MSNVCRAQGAEFFTALFGSERFEHLVGELMIAAAARVGSDLGAAQLRKLQVLIQALAVNGKRIAPGNVPAVAAKRTAQRVLPMQTCVCVCCC